MSTAQARNLNIGWVDLGPEVLEAMTYLTTDEEIGEIVRRVAGEWVRDLEADHADDDLAPAVMTDVAKISEIAISERNELLLDEMLAKRVNSLEALVALFGVTVDRVRRDELAGLIPAYGIAVAWCAEKGIENCV